MAASDDFIVRRLALKLLRKQLLRSAVSKFESLLSGSVHKKPLSKIYSFLVDNNGVDTIV